MAHLKENKVTYYKAIDKSLYQQLRTQFPSLNSKIIQNIIKKVCWSVRTKGKLDKTKKLTLPIIIDQGFNTQFDNGYYNAFLRFSKINFPLKGKKIISKLNNTNKIKNIEIIPKDNFNYFKIFFVCELPDIEKPKETHIGADINLDNITLSNGKKFNLKPFIYKKLKYRKNKQKHKISTWSKGYIKNISSSIAKYLSDNKISYLMLEDLSNIRSNFKKGKELNYRIHNCFPYNMFKTYLKDACLNNNIDVKFINPHYTSLYCNNCGSNNTNRPKQSKLNCFNCQRTFNADLNAARNILSFLRLNTVKTDDG